LGFRGTTLDSLIDFVRANKRWFSGHRPETDASLDAAEITLGLKIPTCIRSILRDYGYWHATGIESLQESIKNTVAARKHVDLPHQFLVLYDHQDGGVVLIATDIDNPVVGPPVYDLGWEDLPEGLLIEPRYKSYLDYVKSVLDFERDFIDESDIDYDPTKYHSG
jgi:hypothetical protein